MLKHALSPQYSKTFTYWLNGYKLWTPSPCGGEFLLELMHSQDFHKPWPWGQSHRDLNASEIFSSRFSPRLAFRIHLDSKWQQSQKM